MINSESDINPMTGMTRAAKISVLVTAIWLYSLTGNTLMGHCASLTDLFGGKEKEYQAALEKKEAGHRAQMAEKEKSYQELMSQKEALEENIADLEQKLKEATENYNGMNADRDNMLAQLKRLLQEKTETTEIKSRVDQINSEKEKLSQENEVLKQENQSFAANAEKLKSHLKAVVVEKGQISSQLAETRDDQSVVVQKATKKNEVEMTSLKEKVNHLTAENKKLAKELDKTRVDSKGLEQEKSKFQQHAEVLQSQLDDLEGTYESLKKENRSFAEQTREFPRQFADLARQNKRLIEQTADMHYNSGVFYAKHTEFKRAIKEFEKVLDLKPTDPPTLYNLGYIYAEHLIDRPKAMEYFKNYLTYAPDAHDADWVRKYLLTWQTWYGKAPVQ